MKLRSHEILSTHITTKPMSNKPSSRLKKLFHGKNLFKKKFIVIANNYANLSPNLKDKPSAAQLYYSLQKYMTSPQFDPKFNVDFNVVEDLFKTPSKQQFETFTKDSPDELKPKPKDN